MTQNLANKPDRWYPSEYRDTSRPTLAFRLTAGLLVLAWLLLTGWIVSKTIIVGSPDEAANSLFMTRLAATGQYRVDTGLPASALNYLHPRSMAIQGSFLASGSFLGLVQAGAVVIKLFGAGAEKFLTSLLSLGGLLAMFFAFRRFWGRWWSLLGVALIALHPAFFEFATLPYLHNGAFVAGLLIACWALLRLLERPTWRSSFIFGIAFGGALFFRPIEALWTVPAVVIMLLARRLWKEAVVVGIGVIILQLPWLVVNREVYGSFLSSGYTPNGVIDDMVGSQAAATAQRLFTPPGGWSWHWLSSAWWYYILFLPSWSAMAAVALGRTFQRKLVTVSKSVKLAALFLVCIFPLVYYGSWNLYPTTPSSVNGALASYVRYWVVLYLAMVPGVIIILRLLSRRWLVLAAVGGLLISQLVIIWTQPVSGLQARFTADQKYRQVRTAVLAATEPTAVIIAGHNDKYFQDQRLSGFRLPQTPSEWTIIKSLAALRPTYLYAGFGQYQMDDVQVHLAEQNLQLVPRTTIGRDVLYVITPRP